jgi:DUF4097 and DUF4098 domain-containing protein YvlB
MAEIQERITTVRISSTSGRLRIIAQGDAPIALEGRAEVTRDEGLVTIDAGSGRLLVTVPEGSDLVVGATSGRVDVTGRVGNIAVVTGSGRVTIDSAATADVRTGSGRVEIGSVDGECRVRSSSGRVVIRRCGRADVAGESGQIQLEDVHGPATAHCVSGRITVALASAADVTAETVSGRIDVSLPHGVRVHRVTSIADLEHRPADTDCTVAARSGSGRITVSSR